MSDASDTTTDATTATDAADQPAQAETTDWKAEAERLNREARKWEERAKANSGAAKELDAVRKQSMTDTERAVAEAEERGRMAAMTAVGAQLVNAEIRAAAAGRLEAKALDVLVQGLNPAAFLGEDGTVDAKSVQTFVDGIAPAPQDTSHQPTVLDLGQGARLPGNGVIGLGDDNALLRDVKAKLGIR